MKATVATEWLSGCSGCHVAIVDLHEKLLNLIEAVEFVRIPVLIDEKDYPKATIGIVEGAVRSNHDKEALLRLRKSVDKLVAFGTCAAYGGPSGIGWLYKKEEVLHATYERGPTNAGGERPDEEAPKLEDSVYPIDEFVDVDLYLPGCPPHPYFIAQSVRNLLSINGQQLTHRSVCSDCKRRMEKREGVKLQPGAVAGEDDVCFLSQGIICLGSVTLNRCLAQCPNAGVPCAGCAGPSFGVLTEPYLDLRTALAVRMEMLSGIDRNETLAYIEENAPTFYAYAMASPAIFKKPTVELREWAGRRMTNKSNSEGES
jgi:F420-non-reducing hydrogenase small subunit